MSPTNEIHVSDVAIVVDADANVVEGYTGMCTHQSQDILVLVCDVGVPVDLFSKLHHGSLSLCIMLTQFQAARPVHVQMAIPCTRMLYSLACGVRRLKIHSPRARARGRPPSFTKKMTVRFARLDN